MSYVTPLEYFISYCVLPSSQPQSNLFQTKYLTKTSGAQATPAVGGGQANVGGNDKVNSNEPTTTVRTTSTATRTITVKPSTTTGPATGSFIGSSNGEDTNAGSGSDCAAPVTVTVALSTVTVTYTPPAATGTAASVPDAVVPGDKAVETTAASEGTAEAPSTTAKPTSSVASEEPVTVVTIPVIPVPYKNSTETSTRQHNHPSGFMTVPKITGTGSSIKPVRTGWY